MTSHFYTNREQTSAAFYPCLFAFIFHIFELAISLRMLFSYHAWAWSKLLSHLLLRWEAFNVPNKLIKGVSFIVLHNFTKKGIPFHWDSKIQSVFFLLHLSFMSHLIFCGSGWCFWLHLEWCTFSSLLQSLTAAHSLPNFSSLDGYFQLSEMMMSLTRSFCPSKTSLNSGNVPLQAGTTFEVWNNHSNLLHVQTYYSLVNHQV